MDTHIDVSPIALLGRNDLGWFAEAPQDRQLHDSQVFIILSPYPKQTALIALERKMFQWLFPDERGGGRRWVEARTDRCMCQSPVEGTT